MRGCVESCVRVLGAEHPDAQKRIQWLHAWEEQELSEQPTRLASSSSDQASHHHNPRPRRGGKRAAENEASASSAPKEQTAGKDVSVPASRGKKRKRKG